MHPISDTLGSLTRISLLFAQVYIVPPVSAASSPPPPSQTYIAGFPLCDKTGFNQVPGDYVETVHQQKGSSLSKCYDACLHNSTCKSFAYVPRYTECIFYDHIVEDTQLWQDKINPGEFAHYDLCCKIPKNGY